MEYLRIAIPFGKVGFDEVADCTQSSFALRYRIQESMIRGHDELNFFNGLSHADALNSKIITYKNTAQKKKKKLHIANL